MRIDTGNRLICGNCLASAGSEYSCPDLPEAVATLVAQALNKRPEDRYQTGAQLAQALTHAMDNALQQSIGEVTAAVVYDPDRSPAEQSMLLTKTTVLEHPQQQSPASRPVAAPVG